MNDYDARFDGLRRLYGDADYARLRELRFCVVGIGGVGSWAVEALARSGVGQITLIDWDTIAASNSNRQLHALTPDYGRKKIDAMAERVTAINPDCEVVRIDDFVTTANLADYMERGHDWVIDAIDSISFKAAMIYHCRRNKIGIITTGGAGGRTDPTQIQVRDLSRTHNDALAARVRSVLRADHGYSRNPKRYFGVECVFSTQSPVYPRADGSVGAEKPGIHGVHLDCRFGYGASVCVTSMFGFIAAERAIRKTLAARARRV